MKYTFEAISKKYLIEISYNVKCNFSNNAVFHNLVKIYFKLFLTKILPGVKKSKIFFLYQLLSLKSTKNKCNYGNC